MRQIAVIGLGYVGLPLAVELGKKYSVTGFDLNTTRVQELLTGHDRTGEVCKDELVAVKINYTTDSAQLKNADFFIVTVPTPITDSKQPDLNPIIKASESVGKVLKRGDIVVYESTVYPGCTEEICVPILERLSGLTYNKDFFCGYSPERINPGDKEHRLSTIMKVVSGSSAETLNIVDAVYSSIIQAGTYKASSIKVAEAAKVIENTQRDINIAFVNELSLIFERLNLDTQEVLAAAGTKWNFLKFSPGLVGGHCIGVDPYYLTFKAESLGYHPQVILSGRRINDGMGTHIANQVVKLMIKKNIIVNKSRVLILGMTFKENCPDVRNSRVIDIIQELKEFGCAVDVYDPHALADEVKHEYQIDLLDKVNFQVSYDAVVLAVAHSEFRKFEWSSVKNDTRVIYDVKGLLDKKIVDGRL